MDRPMPEIALPVSPYTVQLKRQDLYRMFRLARILFRSYNFV